MRGGKKARRGAGRIARSNASVSKGAVILQCILRCERKRPMGPPLFIVNSYAWSICIEQPVGASSRSAGFNLTRADRTMHIPHAYKGGGPAGASWGSGLHAWAASAGFKWGGQNSRAPQWPRGAQRLNGPGAAAVSRNMPRGIFARPAPPRPEARASRNTGPASALAHRGCRCGVRDVGLRHQGRARRPAATWP